MISICLFFTVFSGVLLWAFCQKKPLLEFDGNHAAARMAMTPRT